MKVSERLHVGELVGDKYRIEGVLGRGGMGVVVAAEHVLLGQSVALKLVSPDAANRERLSLRILREARAGAALRGKRVAHVLDVDRLGDGTHFLVMERLVGRSLRCLLDEAKRLPWPLVIDYALEACEALAEAHDAGIVHRDIKPANLYLVGDGRERVTVRLLDFGVCRALHPVAAGWLSQPAEEGFVGSPPYVSPEQLACPEDVSPRSDLWSLGVVLYECLSGTVPFWAKTLAGLWQTILLEPAPHFDPALEVPPALERVVRRCLEKDPGKRFRDVRALARQLTELRLPTRAPCADLPRPWNAFPGFYFDW